MMSLSLEHILLLNNSNLCSSIIKIYQFIIHKLIQTLALLTSGEFII